MTRVSVVQTARTQRRSTMNWSEVLADPSLQDLPYKIETNGLGQIVMTPASNRHGQQQLHLGRMLMDLKPEGDVQVECSINTPSGVKVADVAWYSKQFIATHGDATPFEQAPELCIEVCSPSNSSRELEEKMRLYFEQGAKEVWFCSDEGQLEFHTNAGQVDSSDIFPGFPMSVE